MLAALRSIVTAAHSAFVPKFKQPRSEATYEALIAAATKLFAARGFDATQTPEIAAAAGVSTGALYRYFSDKRQLFIEITARRFAKAQAEVFARLAATRFEDGNRRRGIEQVLDIAMAQFRNNVELEREVLSMSLRDPTVEKLRTNFERSGVDMIAHVIEQWTDRARVPSPRAAALMLQFLVIEMAADRSGLRPQVAPDISDAQLRTALTDLVERYLFAPPLPGSPSRKQPSKRKAAVKRGGAPTTRKPRSSRRSR